MRLSDWILSKINTEEVFQYSVRYQASYANITVNIPRNLTAFKNYYNNTLRYKVASGDFGQMPYSPAWTITKLRFGSVKCVNAQLQITLWVASTKYLVEPAS